MLPRIRIMSTKAKPLRYPKMEILWRLVVHWIILKLELCGSWSDQAPLGLNKAQSWLGQEL